MKIPKNLDWNLLKNLNICSRHKSFYEAAAEAGVLPPAFSKQLKKLEQQVGKELFERVNDNAFNRLTPFGFELLKKTLHFEKILHHDHLSFLEEEEITVYTTHGVASKILPSIIDAYLSEYHQTKVHIITNEIPSKFNSDTILIRANSDAKKEKNIEKIKLLDIQAGFYASKDYIKRKGHPKKFIDLKNHDLLFSFGNKMMENLAGHDIFLKTLFTSTDINFSYAMCVKGYGILEMPTLFQSDPNLIQVLEEEPLFNETLYVWCYNKMMQAPSVSHFIKTVKNLFKD